MQDEHFQLWRHSALQHLTFVFMSKVYRSMEMCFKLVGYIWAEDKEHCEEYGRMLQADPSKVSNRAKKRGLPQVRQLMCLRHVCCCLSD